MSISVVTPGPIELVAVGGQLPSDRHPFAVVPGMWDKAWQTGLLDLLATCSAQEPFGPLGVSSVSPDGACQYWLAARITGGTQPDLGGKLAQAAAQAGLGPVEHKVVPEGRWAVIPAKGPLPGSLQDVIDHHERLLSDAGLSPTATLRIEAYAPGDRDAPDYMSWLWVPVL